ncbi:MAG TPA: histidine kinase [Holophagaceae bacterium]|nr:histidine kinase [Holophagaceae bacterium]
MFSEAWIATLTGLDIWLYRHAGIPVSTAQLLVYNLLITAPIMVLAGYVISRFEDSDQAREEALALAKASQAKLLQSQMHPHVLFNSLNGIVELIVKDPPAAEESVRALSDLLRRLLAAAESPFIALSEERAMVEAYLALESLRLGSRMEARWEWDSGLQDLRVPPLTLQPLVENAIKHGISPSKRGGTLVVILEREGNGLVLAVKNTGVSAQPSSAPGFGMGLRNLRERLVLAYGTGATLTLEREGDWTVALVRIRDFILPP